ncbi:MAG: asparagine synthase (glutamine-hydrolyzing), partial [Clostridia bacterium]|nr:asparagine synthase (glutamine-hydrolyzing) [Clostridia bacterium]
MCSICGIFDLRASLTEEAERMSRALVHRGPDSSGSYFREGVALCHNRLAVMDIEGGTQPMSVEYKGEAYTIVYNGEVYNTDELKKELLRYNIKPKTRCDTELVLWSYVIWGEDCPKRLNGIFSFAVHKSGEKRLFLARDRFGIKPLYYTFRGESFLFASEIKALFECGVKPTLDKYGLWELLYLSPVTLKHSGVFRRIRELGPAECGFVDEKGAHFHRYWRLEARRLEETREEMIENTKCLLVDAIEKQLVSDAPLCTFLSGGLDSSVITAVASASCNREGKTLSTYSFEYENNKESFKTTLFQPNSDDAYATWLSAYLGTNHTVLTVPTEALAECLSDAVISRDLPGQADIDSSLWYFCREVKKKHTVALSGECSDEIFGGYPWFYRPEMLKRSFFPWIHEPRARISLFDDAIVKADEGFAYISEIYKREVGEAEFLDEDSEEMRTSRIATRLSVDYFMTNLLARKDRMSMAHALEVRVPFADHRIL